MGEDTKRLGECKLLILLGGGLILVGLIGLVYLFRLVERLPKSLSWIEDLLK